MTAAMAGPDFEWLEAEQVGRTVVIDYRRVKGPLPERSLRVAVIAPDGEEVAMPVTVGRRRGRWTFPDVPRPVDAVELQCPKGCQVRGLPVAGLSLPVRDGGEASPPPPSAEVHPKLVPSWSTAAPVITACERAFDAAADEVRCLELVGGFAEIPVPAIQACDEAFDESADQLACLEAGTEAPRDPSEAIRACREAFTGGQAQLTCVDQVVQKPLVSPAVVRACGEAFVSQTAQASCVDLGLRRPTQAPTVVLACDEAFVGEPEQLQCLEQGLANGDRP